MRSEEYTTLLAALADIQTAVDATALDVERVVEILAPSDTDSPQPPEWVNGGAEDAAGGTEVLYPSVAYPPPARGNLGAVAGLLVIAACAALLVVLLVLLWLVGN